MASTPVNRLVDSNRGLTGVESIAVVDFTPVNQMVAYSLDGSECRCVCVREKWRQVTGFMTRIFLASSGSTTEHRWRFVRSCLADV